MRHLFTLESSFYGTSVYVGMLVHKHILACIVLFRGEQLLGVPDHVEPRVYPLRTEDKVTIVRYHDLFDTLAQAYDAIFSPRSVLQDDLCELIFSPEHQIVSGFYLAARSI